MQLKEINNTIFENIKHNDEEGKEYWLARELQQVLKYKEWRKFNKVINKAIDACKNSNVDINRQFVQLDKLSINVNGGQRKILEYKLSRYACYLITQNGDSHMEIIALAQTYFAIQTRKQELYEQEYDSMSEDEKRIYQRNLTKKGNYTLNKTVSAAEKILISFITQDIKDYIMEKPQMISLKERNLDIEKIYLIICVVMN